MKNPTYATFMNEVDSYISKLSKDDLKKIILNLAHKQRISNRNDFLHDIKESINFLIEPETAQDTLDISPDKFLQEIKEYEERILEGEFFDEEESFMAYEREERSYWRRDDYYDDEIDFSNEEYVLEAVSFLETAKIFYRHQDINTAYLAYEMLFKIFENPEYCEAEEYFIYGFSFEEAIDDSVLKKHKTIYLRCQYLKCLEKSDFKSVYNSLREERNIFLSDIIEIDRQPLSNLDNFINGFIQLLNKDARYDGHLLDALFVKGGVEEVKNFAYSKGDYHPSIFLYYYEHAKDNQFAQADLLDIILNGIRIIPEKYRIRSYLSLDLIKIAKKSNDKINLVVGYSTAFYSNPSLQNFAFYLDVLLSENITTELNRLKNYLNKEKIQRPQYSHFHIDDVPDKRDIFSLDTAYIDFRALFIGRYILAENFNRRK